MTIYSVRVYPTRFPRYHHCDMLLILVQTNVEDVTIRKSDPNVYRIDRRIQAYTFDRPQVGIVRHTTEINKHIYLLVSLHMFSLCRLWLVIIPGIVTRCPLELKMKRRKEGQEWYGKISYQDFEEEIDDPATVEKKIREGITVHRF